MHQDGGDGEDYSRGRERIRLFEGKDLPGLRISFAPGVEGLPIFNAKSEAASPEMVLNSSKHDPLRRCAPNGESKGRFIYNVWSPELVVFPPGNDTKFRTDAAFVVAPGGGEEHLDWDTEGISVAYWLNRQGITAFLLKYRVPDVPHHLEVIDAQRAMSMARHVAPRYGINPHRIGFWGSSTGGHMGLRLTFSSKRYYPDRDDVDKQPWKPDFLVLLYPLIPDKLPTAFANPHMPPTVMGYAQDDPCCPSSAVSQFVRNAYTKWIADDEHYVFQMYTEGRHGWSDCGYYPYLRDIGAEVCQFKWYFVRPWLQRMLKKQLPYDELPPDAPVLQSVGSTGSFGPEASAISAVFDLLV